MHVDRRLAEYVARVAVAEPYRQVRVMSTREFADWLRKRGINLRWQTLHELWELGALHPVAVLEPAIRQPTSERFIRVDLGYEVASFIDLGQHVEDVTLRSSTEAPAPQADALLWHPFQLPLFSRLRRVIGLNIAPEAHLYGEAPFADLARRSAKHSLESMKDFANSADHKEFVQMTAVLLAAEPLVHGIIDSRIITNPVAGETFDGYFEWMHSVDVAAILAQVGVTLEEIEKWHHNISIDAQLGDPLESWRILVRHGSRDKRHALKGDALRADTLYDAAEILRRYLEVYHERDLPEEDDAIHGPQSQVVKERLFGSRRTADFDRTVFRRIVRSFDLDPQARTTWFFEGDTEEGFVEQASVRLRVDLTRAGVDLMNLKGLGGLKSERFLSLLERLQREQVFPFVTIDFDQSADGPGRLNHYASGGLLPAGYRIWKPDFEVANFALDELAAVAANMVSDDGVTVAITGDEVKDEMQRSGKPAGTSLGRLLSSQKYYGLKGKGWGRYLANWAMDHPCPPELAERGERPAIGLLHFVLRGQTSDYVSTVESVFVDECGNLVRKTPKDRDLPPEAWRPAR